MDLHEEVHRIVEDFHLVLPPYPVINIIFTQPEVM
jgi:hypothetical protein